MHYLDSVIISYRAYLMMFPLVADYLQEALNRTVTVVIDDHV
jgi:hypothetical protein